MVLWTTARTSRALSQYKLLHTAAVLVQFMILVPTSTTIPPPNFIKLPQPKLVCVPSTTTPGCFTMELTNLHVIPEENRVLFLFTRCLTLTPTLKN